MRGLKIFLILLFLIGILFIIGITLGSTHSDDQSVQTPGWLSNFGSRFIGPQPLKVADLSPTLSSCLQQEKFVVPVGSTCTFAIHQSTFAQRVATMQLVQGASVTITLTQEETMSEQQSLSGSGATTTNTDLKVYPGKAHGMLSIACLDAGGAPACILGLK
jgi:hypothetical protein